MIWITKSCPILLESALIADKKARSSAVPKAIDVKLIDPGDDRLRQNLWVDLMVCSRENSPFFMT
jgi:hypothetical protein